MKPFYSKPDFLLALLALVFIMAGDLLRKGLLSGKRVLKVLGRGALIGAVFFAIVRCGDLTTRTGLGAFHQLSPFFYFIFQLNKNLAAWLKINSQPLITGGIIFLFFSGILALLFKKKAGCKFFWSAFSLTMAIKGQSFLVAGQRKEGFMFYLMAAAGAFFFAVLKDPPEPGGARETNLLKKIGVVLLIIGALLSGFYDLDRLPGFDTFEATNAIVSLQVNEGDPDTFKFIWRVHARSYAGDSSSSPFIVLSTAFIFRIAGATLFTFRSMAVFWGLAALVLLYLLIKELFGYRTAFLSVFLSAISPWYLAIIRVGTFGSISIFFALLIFYLFIKAIRSYRVIFYLLTGLLLSSYCFFYLLTKTLVPFIVVMLLYKSLLFRNFFKKNWAGIAAFLATFILFFSFHSDLSSVISGKAYASESHFPFIGSETRADKEVRWHIIPGQLQENLNRIFSCLFILRGGGSFTHPPFGPLLNRTIFMLAILGLAFTIPRFKREEYFFLLAWLGPALMPDFILIPTIGSFSRHGLLCIPLIYVLASIFVVKTGDAFSNLLPGGWSVITSTIANLSVIVLLIALAIINLTYFFNQPPEDYTGFSTNVKSLLSRGYNLTIYLEDGTLHPARHIDFISYPEVKKLYYHHNTEHYYDYLPAGVNPRYRYEVGTTKLEKSLKELLESQGKSGVVVVPAYGKALKELVAKLLPEVAVEEIHSRCDKTILGYQCLVDPEKRGK